MPMFDSLDWNDPSTMAMLGTIAGLGKASAPSRLPVPFGVVAGDALEGAVAGAQTGIRNRQASTQFASANLDNYNKLVTTNLYRQYVTGEKPLTMKDIQTGNFSGTGPDDVPVFGGVPKTGNDFVGAGAPPPSAAAPGTDTSNPAWYLKPGAVANAPLGVPSMASPTGSAPVGPGMPPPASATAPAGGGSNLAQLFMMQRLGIAPTDYQKAKIYAQMQQPGTPQSAEAEAAAMHAAGDRYQLMRNGWAFDRLTNQWIHNPELGQGVTAERGADGQMHASVVPGAQGAIGAIQGTIAGAKAAYEPMGIIPPGSSSPVTVSRSALPALTARYMAQLGNGAPTPVALTPVPTSQPGTPSMGTPQPSPVASPTQSVPGGPGPAGRTTNTGPTIPFGADVPGAQSAQPGFRSALSPLEETSQKVRAEELEKYGSGLDGNAVNAVNNNFLIDQMRREGPSFDQGKFADVEGDARAMLDGFRSVMFPDSPPSQKLADWQSFNKNSLEMVRQAVRATSSRAAVQEFTMIQGALPSATMSSGGFNEIANQFQSINDFNIAKQHAAQQWRQTHGQTLDGFDPYWNTHVTPGAFLLNRMGPSDLQGLYDRLNGTNEGKLMARQLTARAQWAGQHGLFEAGP